MRFQKVYIYIYLQDFQESGAVRKKQQQFQNVVNEPLLTGDPQAQVLGLVSPPELHILIGE